MLTTEPVTTSRLGMRMDGTGDAIDASCAGRCLRRTGRFPCHAQTQKENNLYVNASSLSARSRIRSEMTHCKQKWTQSGSNRSMLITELVTTKRLGVRIVPALQREHVAAPVEPSKRPGRKSRRRCHSELKRQHQDTTPRLKKAS